MTDFHDNIFYYYRGPEQSQQKQVDPQLENNTTKALVNTLKHCDPAVALKFLEWLGITATGKVETELQKTTIGKERIHRTSQRLLLGLIATDSISTKLEEPVSGDSRPDAWLYGEDFVVLIESKVGNDILKSNQMRSHFCKLKVDTLQEPRCEVRTWAEVHRFFVDILPELKDKNKFLVEQFTQYLRWKDMTEFTGFEEGMFEFFVRVKKDADEKKWIRDTMGRFAKRILDGPNGLQALNASFYQMSHVGNFSSEDDHIWVAFGPDKPANFRNVAHQTISLYDFGLEVLVNVELLPAANMLRKRIRSDKQTFIEIVSGLPEPFRIEIAERKPIPNKPRKIDEYLIATLEAGTYKPPHQGPYGLKDSKSIGFDDLERLLKQIPLPYFSLRKRIDRKRVLKLSEGNGDDLVEEVVRFMKEFHLLVEFINKRR